MPLNRRTLLAAAALPALRLTAAHAAEPILAGVSGPLTGPNAQYGAQWKRGFDLVPLHSGFDGLRVSWL